MDKQKRSSSSPGKTVNQGPRPEEQKPHAPPTEAEQDAAPSSCEYNLQKQVPS